MTGTETNFLAARSNLLGPTFPCNWGKRTITAEVYPLLTSVQTLVSLVMDVHSEESLASVTCYLLSKVCF